VRSRREEGVRARPRALLPASRVGARRSGRVPPVVGHPRAATGPTCVAQPRPGPAASPDAARGPRRL